MNEQWLWIAQYVMPSIVSGGLVGSFTAWRRDRRQGNKDEMDLTELIRKMARSEVIEAYKKIEVLSQKVTLLEEGLSSAKQYIIILITRWNINLPNTPPPEPPESLGLDKFIK